jgi:NDP-sugar pyrophosphorylase family protein
VDLALASVLPFASDIAVNVHYLAEHVRAHLEGSDVHISDETAKLLGSGGALGHLRAWINGRAVLVRNSDAYLTGSLDALVADWDGLHPRILGTRVDHGGDFADVRYVGASLIPAAAARSLPDDIAALNDLVWVPAWKRGELEIVLTDGEFVDCGTAHDYLRANLLSSHGESVIGPGAVIEGSIERVVVWDDGWVGPDETLRDCIRVGRDLTVDAR